MRLVSGLPHTAVVPKLFLPPVCRWDICGVSRVQHHQMTWQVKVSLRSWHFYWYIFSPLNDTTFFFKWMPFSCNSNCYVLSAEAPPTTLRTTVLLQYHTGSVVLIPESINLIRDQNINFLLISEKPITILTDVTLHANIGLIILDIPTNQ